MGQVQLRHMKSACGACVPAATAAAAAACTALGSATSAFADVLTDAALKEG